MKIVIDAMGGDNAPDEIVKGAALAKKELLASMILVGDEEVIRKSAEKQDISLSGITVCHAPDVITMEDSPLSIRDKSDRPVARARMPAASGREAKSSDTPFLQRSSRENAISIPSKSARRSSRVPPCSWNSFKRVSSPGANTAAAASRASSQSTASSPKSDKSTPRDNTVSSSSVREAQIKINKTNAGGSSKIFSSTF